MTLRVTVQQAAANALKRWLDEALDEVEGGVTVYDRWPDATVELAPKAIAILLAGAPTDELFDPVVLSQTPVDTGAGPDPVLVDVVYRVRCRRQPLQLSLWAGYDTHRDDLCARLDDTLNASDNLTVDGVWNAEPVRVGLTLPLAEEDGFTGFAEFFFEGPELDSTADKSQQQEFTAIYRGHVDVMLTQTARVSKIVDLEVLVRTSPKPLPPADPELAAWQAPLITTVITHTPTGVTITKVLPP